MRYLDWLRGLVTLNFGVSHAYDTPIIELVAERLAVTLPLALLAMALTVVLALAAGLYAASRHNRAGDLGVMALSQLGIAVPSFWFGIPARHAVRGEAALVPLRRLPWLGGDEGGGLWENLRAGAAPWP